MGISPLSVLAHLERLRQAYGGLDGLALLRGVLEDSPLIGKSRWSLPLAPRAPCCSTWWLASTGRPR